MRYLVWWLETCLLLFCLFISERTVLQDPWRASCQSRCSVLSEPHPCSPVRWDDIVSILQAEKLRANEWRSWARNQILLTAVLASLLWRVLAQTWHKGASPLCFWTSGFSRPFGWGSPSLDLGTFTFSPLLIPGGSTTHTPLLSVRGMIPLSSTHSPTSLLLSCKSLKSTPWLRVNTSVQGKEMSLHPQELTLCEVVSSRTGEEGDRSQFRPGCLGSPSHSLQACFWS